MVMAGILDPRMMAKNLDMHNVLAEFIFQIYTRT